MCTAAHKGICLPNHFIPYFCAPGVKQHVKRSKELQGTRIFRFEPLISVRIEESSKTSKIQPKTAVSGQFFKVCSILAEKQQPKPKNISSLKLFPSFDTLLDPWGAKVKDEMILEANSPVWATEVQNIENEVFQNAPFASFGTEMAVFQMAFTVASGPSFNI